MEKIKNYMMTKLLLYLKLYLCLLFAEIFKMLVRQEGWKDVVKGLFELILENLRIFPASQIFLRGMGSFHIFQGNDIFVKKFNKTSFNMLRLDELDSNFMYIL